MPKRPSSKQLKGEDRKLRARLEKAEAALREVLSGEADAMFVAGMDSAQLFTLAGPDQSYRQLIENMSEGALTLTPDGLVLYANRRFAELLRTSLEKVIGSRIHIWVAPDSKQILATLLRKGAIDSRREQLVLSAADGTRIPVYLSVSSLALDGIDAVCMIVTDLTEQKRTESVLAEEKLARAILEQAADAIVICDETGRIIRASERLNALYGKSPLGLVFDLTFPLRRLDGTAISTDGSINTNSSRSVEASLALNGQHIDLLVSVGHLKGEQNKLLGSVITLADITERRKTQLALQESELQLSEALTIAKIGYWIYEYSTEEFIFNDQYYSLHNMTAEEAGGYRMSFADFTSNYVYPEDAPIVAQQVQLAFETLDRDYSAKFEVRILSGKGEIIWVDTRFNVKRDEQGDTTHLQGINQDISERKLHRLELLESERRFSDMFQNVELVSVMLDNEARLTYCNNYLLHLTGWQSEEIIGKNWFDVFVPPDITDFRDTFYGSVLDNKPGSLRHENDIVTRSGERRLIRWNHALLRSPNGEVIGTASIGEDITDHRQAETDLRWRTAFFESLVKASADGILVVDSAGKKILQNQRLNQLLTIPQDIAANPDDKEQLAFVTDQVVDAKNFGDKVQYLYSHPKEASQDEIVLKNGTILDRYSAPVLDSDGHSYGRIWSFHDSTERKKVEAKMLHLNRVLFLMSSINTLVVRAIDHDELFRETCDIATNAGGFRMAMLVIVDPDTMLPVTIISTGKNDDLLADVKSVMSTSEGMQSCMVGQAISGKNAVTSNNTQIDPRLLFGKKYAEAGVKSLSVLPLIISDEVIGVLTLYAGEIDFFLEDEMNLLSELADDIAYAIDHINKQERLNYLAYYDELTGLPNRTSFHQHLQQSVANANEEGRILAVILLDIERFKVINDTLGREAGDKLLRKIAERMVDRSADAGRLARFDADHFAVLVQNSETREEVACLVKRRIDEIFAPPFRIGETVLRITAKFGIAMFPDDGTDSDTLLKRTEVALKRAKASGEQCLFYKLEMNAAAAEKLAMENQLHQAIDNEEFVLHYQPKVNMLSGEVTSAEALIRWNDPRTGLVPPGIFIPILEETGMIYQVGRWALQKATEDNMRWRAAGLATVRLAVNVSPLQLRNGNFSDEIKQVIALHKDAAAGLELEITESVVMENVDFNITILQAIRALGVTIAIDDFGTGFSSLSYLAKLPVDTLKIDRAFVMEMTAGPEGLSLISTIINLAHALKLKVVAEGVETDEQSRLLRLLGCDEMQGFLYSKAVPAEIFEKNFLLPASTE